MNYALISNNTITAYGSASELWPGTSFSGAGPNPAYLLATGGLIAQMQAIGAIYDLPESFLAAIAAAAPAP